MLPSKMPRFIIGFILVAVVMAFPFMAYAQTEPSGNPLELINMLIAWIKGDVPINSIAGLEQLAAIVFGLFTTIVMYITSLFSAKLPAWMNDKFWRYVSIVVAAAIAAITGRFIFGAEGVSLFEILTYLQGGGFFAWVYDLVTKKNPKLKTAQ